MEPTTVAKTTAVERIADVKAIADPTYDGEWLVQHAKHLGSSDAAAICGVSTYKQAYDIWIEKTGRDVLTDIPDDHNNAQTDSQRTAYMRRGKAFEAPIVAEYAATVDDRIEHPQPMMESIWLPYLSCTPDAIVPGERIVEIKLCHWRRAAELGEDGSDDVFPDWLIQVHHQMIVTGYEAADVFVCVDPHQYRRFRVEKNEKLVATILERLAAFWELVQADTPPDLDFDHETTKAILARVPVTERAEQIIAPGLIDDAERYKHLGKRVAKLDKLREIHRLRLMHAMGTAGKVELLDGDGVPRHVLKRTEIAAKAISFTRKASTRLSISKPKGGRS